MFNYWYPPGTEVHNLFAIRELRSQAVSYWWFSCNDIHIVVFIVIKRYFELETKGHTACMLVCLFKMILGGSPSKQMHLQTQDCMMRYMKCPFISHRMILWLVITKTTELETSVNSTAYIVSHGGNLKKCLSRPLDQWSVWTVCCTISTLLQSPKGFNIGVIQEYKHKRVQSWWGSLPICLWPGCAKTSVGHCPPDLHLKCDLWCALYILSKLIYM